VSLDGHPLLQSWGNYLYKNNQWTYEYFAPDANGQYAVASLAGTYSIDHLLFQWSTVGTPTGVHEMEIDFLNGQKQNLRLMIDNNLPDLDIIGIQYNQQTVQPCQIVNIVQGKGPVSIQYRAYDYAGDMLNYGLTAYHGEGVADVIVPATSPAGGLGVTNTSVNAPANFPSVQCAYEFRLWAYPNVINGYSQIGYTETSDHVTFVVPNAPTYKVLATKPVFPFGLKSADGRTGKIGK